MTVNQNKSTNLQQQPSGQQAPVAPGEADQRVTFGARLDELVKKPHRHPAIHWAALVISILSLGPVFIWAIRRSDISYANWYWADIVFSVFFIFEFVTRSGFRWDPPGYTRTHFFDFIAIVPALVLVQYQVPWFSVWVWIVLVARVVRALDRILGDGFIPRNLLAIAEGFEEEITDRVTLRILDRVQADLDRGHFTTAIGSAIEGNKEAMLEEVHAQHPHILENGLVQTVGITRKVEKAEENVFDSIVKFLKSPELDKTVRDSLNSTFSNLRKSVAEKSWKKNLGFRHSKS
jgi:hypothetical protein